MHPCPVCGSEHQTCGAGVDVDVQDDCDVKPDQGPGPLRAYVVNGERLMLTADDAERLGGVLDE